MCKNNTDDFCRSIVKGISKDIIVEMDVYENPPMITKVFNFLEHSKPPIGNNFILRKLTLQVLVPALCRDETLCDTIVNFFYYDLKFTKSKVLKIIEMRSKSKTKCLFLSVSIDGTKNLKEIEMSRACKSLLGGGVLIT